MTAINRHDEGWKENDGAVETSNVANKCQKCVDLPLNLLLIVT